MNASRLSLLTSWLISFFVIFSSSALAQQAASFRIQTFDPLLDFPSTFVTDIIQDADGYMWFTTWEGLYRYDGYALKHFVTVEGDSSSISNNRPEVLMLDHRDRLWVGTYDGVNLYKPDCMCFQRFMHEPDNPQSLAHPSVVAMTQDHEGAIWIGTNGGGLSRLDSSLTHFDHFQYKEDDPNSLSGPKVRVVFVDHLGTVWASTGNIWEGDQLPGLNRYDAESGKFHRYYYEEGNPYSLGNNYPSTIYEDSQKRLWIGTEQGFLHLYDREKDRMIRYPITENTQAGEISSRPGNSLKIIHEHTASRTFWLGSYGSGLNCFGLDDSSFVHIKNDPGDPTSLVNDGVYTLYEDRQGILWIGSQQGLSWLHPQQKEFPLYNQSENTAFEDKLGGGFDLKRLGDDLYLMGTVEGLFEWKKSTNTYTKLWPNPQQPNPSEVDEREVRDIIVHANGKIFVPTVRGLHEYDKKNKKLRPIRLPFQEAHIQFPPILESIEGPDGALWLSTPFGLITYMPEKDVAELHLLHEGNREFLAMTMVFAWENKLWLGLHNGLFAYDTHKREKDTLLIGGDQSISSLLFDNKQNLWIATDEHGMLLLKHPDSTIKSVSLPNDLQIPRTLGEVFQDSSFNVWFSGQGKTFVFNTEANDWTIFANQDVKYAPQATVISKTLSSGEIYFGGNNAFNLVPKDFFQPFIYKPTLEITQLSGKGEPLLTEVSKLSEFESANEPYLIDYEQNDLSFEFLAFQYLSPGNNLYEYKLEPVDKDWVKNGRAKSVRFTNLEPGKYTFKLKYAPLNQVAEDPQITSFYFQISTPWWQTAWAYVLFAGVFLGLIYAIYQIVKWQQAKELAAKEVELQKERKLNERLQQIDQLKDQFLANTSHELRTPLLGIIGLSESLLDREAESAKQEDLSMIISSGKRLSGLVDDILDFSKLKSQDIALVRKPVNLKALVDVILRINTPLIQGKSLNLANHIPDDFPAIDGDENRLQQILYNLIGNALKFTEKGSVEVYARQIDTFIELEVKDTGIGIPEHKLESIFQEFEQGDGSSMREFAGTGLGLSISKKLVEIHGGKLWVKSTQGVGSSFFLTLPVSSEEAAESLAPVSLTPIKSMQVEGPAEISSFSEELFDNRAFHVMVVDDEPVNQQVIKNHLAGKNFHLTQVMNGEEAMAEIEQGKRFDLVLLDIMMPRMSGYQVCQQIREVFLPSELPIIMITAKNQVRDLVEGLSIGANDYLAKPFSKEEFLARVRTQIDLNRINRTTSKFVPNEFLRSLGHERITQVMLGDQTEREVTVMFSDIRGYTTLAESMTPQETFKFVNAFNGRMGPIIQRQGGFVNQYMGDGIMSIFPESSVDALRAAVGMQKELIVYNEVRLKTNRQAVKIGIGIHTGSLIMGIIGDEERMDAATISDSVNTSARIESLTKYYGVSILLSEESLEKIPNPAEFSLRYLGKVLVKGKQAPIGIYECFDGDDPDVVEKKQRSKVHFDKGLAAFFDKDFAQSAIHFKEVLKELPDDFTTQLFYKRAGEYISTGVPETWTGVEVMASK